MNFPISARSRAVGSPFPPEESTPAKADRISAIAFALPFLAEQAQSFAYNLTGVVKFT
jgi:hypothetical protein